MLGYLTLFVVCTTAAYLIGQAVAELPDPEEELRRLQEESERADAALEAALRDQES